MDKSKYKEYLKSEHWMKVKERILSDRGYCSICRDTKFLNIHHLNYRNLWNEQDEDLVVLCRLHHKKIHFSVKGKFYNTYERSKKRISGLKRSQAISDKIKMLGKEVSDRCNRCDALPTNKYYQVWKNGSRHFVVCCPNCGTHKQRRLDGLKLEILPSKSLLKVTNRHVPTPTG